MILAKDFIETAEGLVFAVVESGLEEGRVLCFLRYKLAGCGWEKLNTVQANAFLTDNHQQYLYYSSTKQAHLHAVNPKQIVIYHHPRSRLSHLLLSNTTDKVEGDLLKLCQLLEKQGIALSDMGVTGSILIAAQNSKSDIDLVFYSRTEFVKARRVVQQLIKQGDCSALTENDWLQSYSRRDCDLSFDEYVWHEKRKFNKAVINQRKFDLSFVSASEQQPLVKQAKKIKAIILEVIIKDDAFAFDYPALFAIEHSRIECIICYTATYTGQAKTGERVEVSGLLEQVDEGAQRIIVGSSREAKGEYIKVIDGELCTGS